MWGIMAKPPRMNVSQRPKGVPTAFC